AMPARQDNGPSRHHRLAKILETSKFDLAAPMKKSIKSAQNHAHDRYQNSVLELHTNDCLVKFVPDVLSVVSVLFLLRNLLAKVQHHLSRATTGPAASHFFLHFGQFAFDARNLFVVIQNLESSLRDLLRRALILQELRRDHFAGDNINKTDVRKL